MSDPNDLPSTSRTPEEIGESKSLLNKYPSGGGKASAHGTVFNLKLLMIALNRGMKLYSQLYLATEMEKAEKFDDVVLRYKKQNETKWSWYFLQSKHKLNTQESLVTERELFIKSKGDYLLAKYFVSFYKIQAGLYFKEEIVEKVVLCTNTSLADDANKYFILIKEESEKDILLHFSETKEYRFNLESIFNKSVKEMFSAQNVNDICELNTQTIDNLTIRTFLKGIQKEIDIERGKLTQEMDKLIKIKTIIATKSVSDIIAYTLLSDIEKEIKNDYIKGKISDKLITIITNDKHRLQEDTSLRNFITELEKEIKLIFDENTHMQNALKHIDKGHLEDFFTKIRLICNCSDGAEIDKIISSELGEQFGLLGAELITHSFEHEIFNWYQESHHGKSKYLCTADGKQMMDLIGNRISSLTATGLSLAYVESVKCCVCYRDIPNEIEIFISNDHNSANSLFVFTESAFLSAIKIVQALQKNVVITKKKDSFIFIKSKDLQGNITLVIIQSFKSPGCHNFLIIEFEDFAKLEKRLSDILSEILNTLKQNKTKKVLFIFKKNYQFVETMMTIMTLFKDCQIFKDNNISFKYFIESSQEKILKSKVTFENQTLCTNQLINRKSAYDITDLELLVKLIKHEKRNSNNLPQVPNHYIDRTLQRDDPERLNVLIDLEILEPAVIFIIGMTMDDFKLFVNKRKGFIYKNNHLYSLEEEVTVSSSFKTLEIEKTSDIRFYLKPISVYEKVIVLVAKGDDCFLNLRIYFKTKKLYFVGYKDSQLYLENRLNNHYNPSCKHIQLDFASEECFVNLINVNKKIWIVASDPGMGKSHFLSSISDKIQQRHQNAWVFRINLNDLTQTLKNITFSSKETDKAINFLTEILLSEEHYQSKSLFNLTLKNLPNFFSDIFPKIQIVLLFDGFDEISPTYSEKALTLLKALENSNFALMCITTRYHEVRWLSDNLSTNNTFILLAPEDKQKIEFLNNLWQRKIQCLKINKPDEAFKKILNYLIKFDHPGNNFGKYLISETQNIRRVFEGKSPDRDLISLRNEVKNLDFTQLAKNAICHWDLKPTDIPLYLKLYGDILFSNRFKLDGDLYKIYFTFIETKFDFYYNNKVGIQKSLFGEQIRSCHEEILRDQLGKIAFSQFFPQNSTYVLNGHDRLRLLRTGFLISDKDCNDLKFIQYSFAEYFLAQYLIEHKKNSEIFFNKILCEKQYKTVRIFLNENRVDTIREVL